MKQHRPVIFSAIILVMLLISTVATAENRADSRMVQPERRACGSP